MRYILLLIPVLFICSCGTKHTRTSLENTQVLMQYQVKAAQSIAASEAMATAGPSLQDFVREMGAIGQVAQDAIRPAQTTLKLQSKLFPWSRPEQIKADISLEGLHNDFQGEIAKTKFRAQMAQEEADNGWLAILIRNMQQQSWSMWLFGLASTFITGGSGLMVFNKIRNTIKHHKTENEVHKEVAKNAIHYGKDMEEIALKSGDAEVKRDDIERAIKDRRTISMVDQHKKGLAEAMNKLHGEVKVERK